MNTDPSQSPSSPPEPPRSQTKRRFALIGGALLIAAVITFVIVGILVTMFEHRQEARSRYVRLQEVDEVSTDPVPWGLNWPHQFDAYRRTVDTERSNFGGSSAMTESKLEAHPWLKRLYAGYAFSIDYRELRGHAYMLYDQEVTQRVTKRPQSGACLHCHASVIPTYRRLGLIAQGKQPTTEELAGDFNWPAVLEGFRVAAKMDYATAHAELLKTPDGTPGVHNPLFPGGLAPKIEPAVYKTPATPEAGAKAQAEVNDPHSLGDAHPVSCIDCHDPKTMNLRVTRPGFIQGIAALATSDEPVPHLPSVERWRKTDRRKPYDPNIDASRREMRAFACAQCHVEYYCATKETLFFPWNKGLKVEQIEKTYEEHKFPDGSAFMDFKHGETGAPLFKAQHPEFEMWSQGVHARAGVSCADCHMPYERQGAMKVSSHWVRSPMLNINNACQSCHNVPEQELRDRVSTIQGRTRALIDRAAQAMTEMLDAIREAQAAGIPQGELQKILELQRKGMWRLDFVSSENSLGFHADQESARILAESIDYSRQAQALAVRARAPQAPQPAPAKDTIQGVTAKDKPADH